MNNKNALGRCAVSERKKVIAATLREVAREYEEEMKSLRNFSFFHEVRYFAVVA